MSPIPEDDEDLTQFLRHHRSSPPPAAADLEDRILQSLPRRSPRKLYPLALIAAGVAACFMGVILAQPARSPAIDPELEAFMETNWSTVVDGTSTTETTDYLAFVEFN